MREDNPTEERIIPAARVKPGMAIHKPQESIARGVVKVKPLRDGRLMVFWDRGDFSKFSPQDPLVCVTAANHSEMLR